MINHHVFYVLVIEFEGGRGDCERLGLEGLET